MMRGEKMINTRTQRKNGGEWIERGELRRREREGIHG
jgi:hypothetical protein